MASLCCVQMTSPPPHTTGKLKGKIKKKQKIPKKGFQTWKKEFALIRATQTDRFKEYTKHNHVINNNINENIKIKNKQVFIIIIPVITTLTVTTAIIIILIIIAIIRSLKFYKQEKAKEFLSREERERAPQAACLKPKPLPDMR